MSIHHRLETIRYKLQKRVGDRIKTTTDRLYELTNKLKTLNNDILISVGTHVDVLEIIPLYCEAICEPDALSNSENIFRVITVVGHLDSEINLMMRKSDNSNFVFRAATMDDIKSKLNQLSLLLHQLLSHMFILNEFNIRGSTYKMKASNAFTIHLDIDHSI